MNRSQSHRLFLVEDNFSAIFVLVAKPLNDEVSQRREIYMKEGKYLPVGIGGWSLFFHLEWKDV